MKTNIGLSDTNITNMKKLVILLVAVISLTACSTSKNSKDMKAELFQKWDLKVLNNDLVTGKFANPVYIEFQKDESKVNGSAACNRFFGTYTLNGKSLVFSPFGSTRMYCDEESNKLESEFLQAMTKVTGYKIENKTLILLNNNEEIARFHESNAVPDAMAGTWDLVYITGRRIAFEGLYPEKKPQITFKMGSNELTGNTSCNSFTAAFNNKPNEKLFNPGAMTLKACPGEGEQAFMEQFKRVDSWEISGDTLTFIAEKIPNMKFVKSSN